MITQEVIRDILNRIDIVTVVQQYIPLTRKGRNYIGLCPFHEDSNPSLVVSREKQIFKCFSCGTGGNSIRFLQKYKNISFSEAVKEAAKLAGIDITDEPLQQEDPAKLRIMQLNKDMLNYGNYILQTEEGMEGLEYLKMRGYSQEMMRQRFIGYIPDKDRLQYYLEKKGYSYEEMQKADIFSPNGSCKWEGRILFPVVSENGGVYGFTARTIQNDADQLKYVNTAESDIFHKRELLYIGSETMSEARRKQELIIVEGTADADMLAHRGYANCAATLGTALTEEHIKRIQKMNVKVRLCYDGDKAGIKATLKAASLLRKAGINVLCTTLPKGKDPDILSRENPEFLDELLNRQENTVDFMLHHFEAEKDIFSNRKEQTVSVLKELISYRDPLMKDHYLDKISKVSGFSIQSLQESYALMTESKQHYSAERKQRFPKSDYVPKRSAAVKINFQEKNKIIYKNEVKQKYDSLHQENNVTAYDRHSILNRTDILKKYMHQKGRMLETTITCITDEDIDMRCHEIAESCVKAIGAEHNMDPKSLDYVAYLHKDTKYPHIHIQVWQEEPLLDRYRLTNTLLAKMKVDITEIMKTPAPQQEPEKIETTETIEPEAMKISGM